MAPSKAALFAAAALVLTGAMPAVRAKEMAAAPAAGVEGRPSPADASPLQARVDAAAPGSVIEVGPGTYAGDLVLDKPTVACRRLSRTDL